MITRTQFVSTFAGVALGAAVVATGFTAVHSAPQDAQRAQPADNAEAPVRVGTYEPQTAFDSYYKMEEFTERINALQQQLQQAQQAGDQQAMMNAQMELQNVQNEVVTAFYDDVEQAVPDVAAANDVQVVAIEILYTDDAVEEPVDITEELMKKVNENAAGDEAEHPQPDAPTQPGR